MRMVYQQQLQQHGTLHQAKELFTHIVRDRLVVADDVASFPGKRCVFAFFGGRVGWCLCALQGHTEREESRARDRMT
jgi:hypothetical protein